MTITLSAQSSSTPLVTRTIPTFAAVTVFAVVFAGLAAARAGETAAWFLTPFIAGVILRGAVRSSSAAAPDVDARELPVLLQHRLFASFDRLPEGDARRLLMEVLIQARPLYAARSTGFDARHDSASRENADALIDACCSTALELARLDAAFAAHVGAVVEPQYQPTRELFVKRLTDAASALGALYASGIAHGTPASDRIAELVDEIRADANARNAAGDEMDRMFDAR